jgi:hypothetical protein
LTTATLKIAVNAGAPQTGGITAPTNATLAYSFENTSGWTKYELQVYAPTGWSTPAGWSTTDYGARFVGTTSPPAAVDLTGAPWGKYMHRLIVNDTIVDDATAVSVLSPTGIEDLGILESIQFSGAARSWAGTVQRFLRGIEGAIGGALPALANTLGAVIVEDPAGTRISRRLRQIDIDLDFAIASFGLSHPLVGIDGRTATLLRRGDSVASFTAAATYTSGPPSSASLGDAFANGASGAGAWTFNAPFASGSKAGSVGGNGVDGDPDPSWAVTLTANLSPYPARISTQTVYLASDVYWGSTLTADIVGTDVYNAGLQGNFQSALQRVRQQSNRSFSGANRFDWFLWPDQGTYTNGFNYTTSIRDQNNDIFLVTNMGTLTILRNGVTRTYRKIRSAGSLSSPFTNQVF